MVGGTILMSRCIFCGSPLDEYSEDGYDGNPMIFSKCPNCGCEGERH